MLMKLWTCVFFGVTLCAMAGNPLHFREYRQDFTLVFANDAAAKAAQVAVCPLYGNAKVALSARWDDTNPKGHVNTLAVMKRHGLKGTFFYNSVTRKGAVDFAKEALDAGCTIGLHTVDHPMLDACTPNRIHWEYLLNRIQIEDAVNAPAVAQVVPNGYHHSLNRDYPGDLSRTLQSVGVIAAPELRIDFGREIGYPEHALAESFLLRSGDRDPQPESLKKNWKRAKTSPLFAQEFPALAAAVHSWHTPAGLKALDELLTEMDKQSNAWKCNQNEYGSYRYEYHFCDLQVKREGNELLCSVTRISPEELGAAVPLCFTVQGAVPAEAKGAELQAGLILLPHAADRKLPSVYALAGTDGTNPRVPGMKAELRKNAAGAMELLLKNSGKSSCTDVDVTLYLPPVYETMTCRMERRAIAAGAKEQIPVPAGKASSDLRFRYGEPLWAARIDFTRDGVRNRLYATFTDKPSDAGTGKLPLRLCEAARTFQLNGKNFDWNRLSKADEPLDLPGSKTVSAPLTDVIPGYLLLPSGPRQDSIPMASFVDLSCPADRPLVLNTNVDRLFVNGAEVRIENNRAVVEKPLARNRVAMLFGHKHGRQNFLIPEGGDCRYLVPEKR